MPFIRSSFLFATILFTATACVDEGLITGPELVDEATETPRHIALNHIALNHIALNHIALNGLVAGPEANQAITQVALESGSFVEGAPYPELRFALLNDAWSREFMSYLVSCALVPEQSVSFGSETWRGGLGLCPEWANGPANIDCQERVSACLLARVNKFGDWVPLSMRGDGLGFETLAPSIESFPQDQKTGERIKSLQTPCPKNTKGFADCGWRLEKVVTCQKGQRVKVGAGGMPDSCVGFSVGSASNDVVLRVSAGVRARNSGPLPLAFAQYQDDDTTGSSCRNLKPYLEFTCNENGVYSVLSASYDRKETNTAVVAVVDGELGASEQRVFRQREGTFYGNIFKWYALGVRVYFSPNSNGWRVWDGQSDQPRGEQTIVQNTIFQDMFVCGAPEWTNAAGYFHRRMCALPGEEKGCGARYMGTCAASATAAVCNFDDTALQNGHGGWTGCTDVAGNPRVNAVTTFLAGQCDAVPDTAACGTVNNPLALP